MTKVVLVGWRDGLQKVALSKLQMEIPGLSLSESKANTDVVLEGETVTFHFKDEHGANEFARRATGLGAICEIFYNE
jgi:hypothetical protein